MTRELDLQAKAHTSYLFISHDLSVVRHIADRVAVLYLGRMVEEGATEDVFAPPWHPYTEALLSAVPALGRAPATGAIRLEGPAPNPAAPPPGCPFHPRCPRKLGPVCEREAPPVQPGERGHAIVCHIPRADLLRLQEAPAGGSSGTAGAPEPPGRRSARHDLPRGAIAARSGPHGHRLQRYDRRHRGGLWDPDAAPRRAGVGRGPVADSPTLALSRFALTLSLDDVPAAIVRAVKRLLLDHLGCALGGSRTPLARAAAEVAAADGDEAATVIGTRRRAPPGPAAFANAMAANALDYDDTGATGHPGSTVIPAALALAEASGRSGAELLAAVLAAYEVWIRLAEAVQPSWARRVEVYGSGTTQAFGAVAAAGRLCGLGLEETLSAFGLAGAFAPLPHEAKFGWDEDRLSWV